MTKKSKLVTKLINIQENNWKATGDKPNGLTVNERSSMFKIHMLLTIPMLQEMIANITVRSV